jgi:hypothetical protein
MEPQLSLPVFYHKNPVACCACCVCHVGATGSGPNTGSGPYTVEIRDDCVVTLRDSVVREPTPLLRVATEAAQVFKTYCFAPLLGLLDVQQLTDRVYADDTTQRREGSCCVEGVRMPCLAPPETCLLFLLTEPT